MNVPGGPDYEEFSRANCIKKGALFGFAIGMLVGLFWIGIAPPAGDEMASLTRFQNVILVGIGVGIVIGVFWPRPSNKESSTKDDSA
jgi:hypothetical protein